MASKGFVCKQCLQRSGGASASQQHPQEEEEGGGQQRGCNLQLSALGSQCCAAVALAQREQRSAALSAAASRLVWGLRVAPCPKGRGAARVPPTGQALQREL